MSNATAIAAPPPKPGGRAESIEDARAEALRMAALIADGKKA